MLKRFFRHFLLVLGGVACGCGSGHAGVVGPTGGTVSGLYFAVVGDTRPANEDDTAGYPTPIITKIYQDLEAMNPRPQFVIGTGDYMYANPSGSQGAAQLQLYMQAQSAWTGGPVFHAMGNHECNGYTSSNMDLSAGTCDGSPSNNYAAFFQQMVQPLGQTLPYYTAKLNGSDGSWTAKIIIVACNAWDGTQQNWLQGQLAESTTYTFLVRHENPGASGPCVSAMDGMLKVAKYDVMIVGHSHKFENDYSNGKYIIVGNGGAGYGGNFGFGYATFQQTSSGFTVMDYDYSTAAPATSFAIP